MVSEYKFNIFLLTLPVYLNKKMTEELNLVKKVSDIYWVISFSDVNIEDHYRFKFANTYSNDIKKLKKGFFDIEVDGKTVHTVNATEFGSFSAVFTVPSGVRCGTVSVTFTGTDETDEEP